MRLSDLRGLRIKTLDGKVLGRVHEVHCQEGRVTALTCGVGSFVERLTAKRGGRRIPWECVRRIDRKQILVTPDPPQRITASRTRQGTRQPSARRSGR